MQDLTGLSIKIRNFKCFGDEATGLDDIKPINLIIGRNNTGKSAFLEAVGMATHPELAHGDKWPSSTLVFSKIISEDRFNLAFHNDKLMTRLGKDYHKLHRLVVGRKFTWIMDLSQQVYALDEGNRFLGQDISECRPFSIQDLREFSRMLTQSLGSPFANMVFRRLSSERDIVPEKLSTAEPRVDQNARNLTDLMCRFLVDNVRQPEIVTQRILGDMNRILQPDERIGEIVPRRLSDDRWEISLREPNKGLVPLSASGSGLKTILAALSYIHLLPAQDKTKGLDHYIFAFEELENNLHPALQRRLVLYLKEVAKDKHCVFFITTHSNVIIDLFSQDSDAQILHMTHDGKASRARTVTTYLHSKDVLSDLGFRASDLLQSNCIIWVEGPSDRLYLNRWIGLWSNESLHEGVHYQCVFYGGKLGARLASLDPIECPEDLVNILCVNRNAILLMDSDKKAEDDTLTPSKSRLMQEVGERGGIAWLSDGREIENYITFDALNALSSGSLQRHLGRYEDIKDYLASVSPGAGRRLENGKIAFAEDVLPHLTRESISMVEGLPGQLDAICAKIREWNGLDDRQVPRD